MIASLLVVWKVTLAHNYFAFNQALAEFRFQAVLVPDFPIAVSEWLN